MSTGSSERIRALMTERGISFRELARRTGVSDVAARNWVVRGDQPKGDRLTRLCEALGVTPAWLLFGDESAPRQTVETDDGMIAVPYLDVRASCGVGEPQSYQGLVRFVRVDPAALRARTDARPESLNLITAVGDSMEPTIEAGSAVVVDISPVSSPRDGLWVVAYGDQIFIKRIQVTPSGYRLISDNSRYPPIEIESFDRVKLVGRVIVGLKVEWYS